MIRNRNKKHSKVDKWLKILILTGVLAVLSGAGALYYVVYKSNVAVKGDKSYKIIRIPTGSEFPRVMELMKEHDLLKNRMTFQWLSDKMNYVGNVIPGRYKIKEGMSNLRLIRLLRSGQQEPLNIVLRQVRKKEEIAYLFCHRLEADSARFMAHLNDKYFLRPYGFTPENVLALFIPNTYEFYWNTHSEEIIERMHREYTKFWNEERLEKAKDMNLEPVEVIILASIVEQETYRDSEEDKIAGVYLNRLKKDWKLQADPTLKFALDRFDLDRVLNKHKEVESPYNTYKYKGLPPGPICTPERQTIDATLNAENHDYMYFCAKPDFSGYHNFSKTYQQHLVYARKLQRALNERNIR